MKTEAVIDHITGWLEEYCARAGTKGFVVGVSGGIDSAVSSALAARTGLPTLVVEMPIHQGRDQVSRARDHIAMLKARHAAVDGVEVELTDVFDSLVTALPGEPQGAAREMALVNTRARLRMTTLYYLAGQHGRLVVGTGNKVEDFGVGFFTKYGDGGVDLSPIADLMKSEVYEIGRALGVNDAILGAPPTDGLWGDSRTDEDQIGASYPELEWAMTYDGDDAALTGRQAEVMAIYRRLNRANQHKMVPIPVCEIPDSLR
ncbi:NAD(+) synthase [Defluviimonas sp. WL0050]|uniref:NH(3)-dependent NAD(+) synthetase n=1 Tax=Albidovulum litorale TaxID=2984134 RepID=A0ABT2ZQM0_9RHOB|nr:NAD(+) synthase [Defluviimonas sp. WL0050]MCV2873455.1 NAD(+) synthase [Defluviimonas sp. WL0050]